MNNITAKKRLVKMADKWMKRGLNPNFDEVDFLEDMWQTAFTAYPAMKTAEDSYYVNEYKLSNMVGMAADELEAAE
jgi:hypothetical protein